MTRKTKKYINNIEDLEKQYILEDLKMEMIENRFICRYNIINLRPLSTNQFD